MIIAERELYRVHKDGKLSKVNVTFGQPVRVLDAGTNEESWACSFQIIGLNGTVTRKTEGNDALEALLNACVLAGEHLNQFSEQKEPLMWNGLPGLGFPKFNDEDLQKNLAFAKRKPQTP